jgi:hypothetical protein
LFDNFCAEPATNKPTKWHGSRNTFSPQAFSYPGTKRRNIMKKITLGLVAAAAIFTAAPAMAQIGFYAGPGGVGVGVGAPGPYARCGYDYPCDRGYYDYYDGPAVTFGAGPGWHDGHHWRR